MKKSKIVKLVLITAALAACNRPADPNQKKVYMRSDTTAHYQSMLTPFLWYYAFRPFGLFRGGNYTRVGYYSGALHESANVGTNGFKGSVVRGGFGKGFSVSS